MMLGRSIRHHGGSGEPLLLLHPFALSAEAWRPILPALERRHEVLAATFPGHMGGEAIPSGFQHSVAASVDMAEAELDAAGIGRVHIAGNSLGGWFALELARRGRALSTVAISPGGGWERGSEEEKRLLRTFRKLGRLLRLGGPLAPVLGHIGAARRFGLHQIVSRPDRLTPEQASFLMRAPYRCDTFYDVLRRLPHEPDPRRVDAAAGRIRIVWGSEDRLLPLKGYSERWRRLLPNAEWVVLEGAGHVPMYDDPARVAALILEVTTSASAASRNKTPSIKAAPMTAPATLRPPPAEARAAADG
ncbi:MAG TPA: alpha/beta hydrolase [Polyangiaceae bacterium]|nr:alpha/beta hydrolase [Polyangiaceae bacterium]